MLDGGVPCADEQPDATQEEDERERCIDHVLQDFDRPKLPDPEFSCDGGSVDVGGVNDAAWDR